VRKAHEDNISSTFSLQWAWDVCNSSGGSKPVIAVSQLKPMSRVSRT
jgi:hypothetical protein